jgi:hypothetical protein
MRIIFAALTLISPLAWTSLSHAEDLIEIDVHTAINPTKAIGLVMSEHGTDQRTNSDISWKRVNPDTVTVSIPLGRDDRAPGTIISALVMNDAGEMAFGNNKPSDVPELSPSIFSLPTCPGPKINPAIESQASLVQSLLEVRAARRAKLQNQLNGTLQGDLLARINKLERGFGMNHGEALSGNLPPLELEDRLARLVQAIKNYRAQRGQASAGAQSK